MIYSAGIESAYGFTQGEFSVDFLFFRWDYQGIVTVLRNVNDSFAVQISEPSSGS